MTDKNGGDKIILQKLRICENLSESEKKRLLKLSLDNAKNSFGEDYVNDLWKKSIYLCYKNEDRKKKKLEILGTICTDKNPVAVVIATSHGSIMGKGIKSHFDTDMPLSTIICVGAKVCIENKNVMPWWGLYSGACGTVIEIVYEKNKSPNKNDHPEYVVVEFPQYVGPCWDKNNLKVKMQSKLLLFMLYNDMKY